MNNDTEHMSAERLYRVAENIVGAIKAEPSNIGHYNALYSLCAGMANGAEKWRYTDLLKRYCAERMNAVGSAEAEKIFRAVLLLEAQGLRLDSYMQYIELNRDPEKRFWMPRRKQILAVCDAIQDLVDDKLDILTISMPPGSGKALADDTPVLTSEGWKTHGELRVGDYVVSPEGEYVEVLAVHPKCEMQYKVTTTDDEEIICHGNHEWYVYNRHRQKSELLKTVDMLGKVENSAVGRGHRYQYMLPSVEPLIGGNPELKVDPYVLGVWLGDGNGSNPAICESKEDYEIISAEFRRRGYEQAWQTVHKTTGVYYGGFRNLRCGLREYGMCHSKRRLPKYIPDEYFRASIEDRLSLLAGLIDTDGTKMSDKNGYRFSTTEEGLRDGFVRLLSTFGWRCYVHEEEPHTTTSGITGRRVCYVIGFLPTMEIPCLLKRKQLKVFSKQRRKAIKSIEPISGIQGNCITVEGGMYCVGNRMIPTHNSTIEIFLHSMMIGAFPDSCSLASGHSGTLTESIYDGVCGILNDPDYLWHDIYPSAGEIITNSKKQTIDVGKKHRFSSLTCRAIGASLTGATRCEKLLTADDLVSGIEEAMSIDRLEKLWTAYTNDLKSRKKLNCKELHIATRWSVHDPIGRLQSMYEDSARARFLVMPAVDEDGESNFVYRYGVGFDRKYYEDMKDNLDDCSWRALYMNQPIEREGLLYNADELRRYFELPSESPDAVISVCDTKDKGSDYCVMPIAYQYGNDFYIEEIICDNGNPEIVETRLTEALIRHKVKMSRFESNSAGGKIAEKVQKEVKSRGGITKITTKYSTANKDTRIIVDSPFVKEHFLFKDPSVTKGNKEYTRAVGMLCGYTMAGKNAHDDVPDAFSMLADFIQSFEQQIVKVIERPY